MSDALSDDTNPYLAPATSSEAIAEFAVEQGNPLLTVVLAFVATASASVMPFSPFGLLLAVYWSRRTIGWERRVTIVAALISAISSLVFAVIVLGTCYNLLIGRY